MADSYSGPDRRQQLDEKLVTAIVEAIASKIPQQPVQHCLNEEEQRWVRIAIEAQAKRIKFRDAVIEKSLAGLVWSGIVGIGYLFMDYLRNHGFK
jgi:hypothetical protein